MKLMKLATKLKRLLNLLKIKPLCNQKQSQLKIHKQFLCKSKAPPTLRFLLQKTTKPSLCLLEEHSEISLLEQTQAEIERLKLQNLEKNEAANQSK